MKMDTLESGRRRASNQRRSRRSTKPATTKARARTGSTSRKSTKASARTAPRRGQPRRGSGSARSTTDLNEIRRWAEARGGKPVSVIGTSRRGGTGLLRIDFPGYSGAGRFDEISWEDWYEKFQESNLEFLYQDKAANGQSSRFFKLVSRGAAKRTGSRSKSQSGSRSRSRLSSAPRASARSRSRSRGKR